MRDCPRHGAGLSRGDWHKDRGQLRPPLAEQRLDALPEVFELPEGRIRPWATAHAVLSAKAKIHGPFAAINADNIYGADAYAKIYEALENGQPDLHAMCGYRVDREWNCIPRHM